MSDEEPQKDDDQGQGDNPDQDQGDNPDQDNEDYPDDQEYIEDEENPKDEEDQQNNELVNNLKLTIEEQGLEDNQKLRKWKDLLTEHVQQVQKLRRRNNNLRGQLKKLGDKAEKLVQSNVRKQKLLEQKLDPKHYNLAEKKILYEIKNGKSKQDFANKIDPRILDLLIAIDKMEQSNSQMRESIKALKDRNKNLEQTEEVNKLSNEIILVEKQIAEEDRLRRKMQVIMKEQEAEFKQQQFDCDYEGRLNSLKDQIKTLKDSIREAQKVELHETRKEFELNNHFAELQKIYRQMCTQLNKPCDEKQHFKQDKQKDQDNQNEKQKKVQEFAQKSQEENLKRFLQLKDSQPQPEDTSELHKALKEFKEDKGKFKQIQEEVKNLQEELEKKEREAQKEKSRQIEEYSKLNEDVVQLAKQLKEREVQTKSSVIKLNDLQRQVQLLDRKQVQEPIQSTHQKPENIFYGIDKDSQTSVPFDDIKNLDWTSNMPINQIVVCKNSYNNLIIGLELTYGDAENKEEQKTTKHIGLQEGSIEKEQIKITPEEKLSYISGFYNSEQIIFLKFETSKKRVIQVGNMKYKDNQTKDFRIEIKDKEILGFKGILDYTQESQNTSERYLVAIGLNLKPKELDISAKKQQKKQKMLEEQEKQRVPVDYRKITYPFRKNHPKHLDLIKSQPKLDVSIYDEEKTILDKLFQKEKERYLQAQRAQLGLLSAKQFSPATYKQQEYLDEDQKRRQERDKRKEWVEQKREENKNTLMLPVIETKTPVDQDKKGAKAQKTVSPQKQQKQPQKEVPKKDDSKAKKK
ncbi:unnamed protein product (macronuclear) [Paramecium tetraurelia]|uniref:Jacalin-type lectin domain-containing protein n=1 Tax=Paramecium tetraurelia TaxID=5888 RepID=A0DL70_PARTE|nr:uncharacterized protein GSPATT00018104001 [Paramecium tetraurelia]CAK83787.1 unnamed protein product [Paramecium tetraurelia]|eukprot:XP_001451184.1 hypothetical protein (macronuclear) [Paramecium tetraurelia strain d4-2]